jgi:6-phosphogluconolactonase
MTGYIVNYNIYGSTDELADNFAKLFKIRCDELLAKKENIFIALSGGSTPDHYLNKLADPEFSKDINWSRIHFFFVDERMVDPMDPGSNYRTIKELFFDKISIPEENIHRIKGEIVPQLEVRRYGNEIVNNVGKNQNSIPEFDWILLGMGSDGHTASIFPDVELKEEYQRITAISKKPETGQIRVTVTEDIINNADFVTFIITGRDKADTVFEVMRGNKGNYPAGRINPSKGLLEFYLDQEAASILLENEKK